jgi:hypothetical protein
LIAGFTSFFISNWQKASVVTGEIDPSVSHPLVVIGFILHRDSANSFPKQTPHEEQGFMNV